MIGFSDYLVRAVIQEGMRIPSRPLINDLAIPVPSVVALIGGGGKTTSMLALGEALSAHHRVLLTTTTRIWPPEGIHCVLGEDLAGVRSEIRGGWERSGQLALGSALRDGKLTGVAPEMLGALLIAGDADMILCEADGSAGRPLKVHASHEPVIPACTATVLVCAGLGALGRTADAASVHRVAEMESRLQIAVGTLIELDLVQKILLAAAGHVPPEAHTVFLLNQADNPERLEAGAELASRLTTALPGSQTIIATHGRAVGPEPAHV